jgi:hypothetical protein
MALFDCPHCGNKVGEGAKACPHCGGNPYPFGMRNVLILLMLLAVLGAVLAYQLLIAGPPPAP